MDLDKPIIVRKGSKTQNRVNLPVTSSFSIGDEVAVITYTDYLAINGAGAGNVTAELEEAKANILELEEKVAELTQINKELSNTNNELNSKIVSLNEEKATLSEEVKEEVKASQLNSNKVATLEERVTGLNKLIASNELAYTNGINNFISITESAVKDSEKQIVNKANDIIIKNNEEDLKKVNNILKKAGLIQRIRGFTIAPEELAPSELTPEDLGLEAITSGTIAKLNSSKPIYKLE